MSSAVATPDSQSRSALRQNGTSRRLTMNAGVSLTRTGVLPVASANAQAASTASSDAVSGVTTSTSGRICAGLK